MRLSIDAEGLIYLLHHRPLTEGEVELSNNHSRTQLFDPESISSGFIDVIGHLYSLPPPFSHGRLAAHRKGPNYSASLQFMLCEGNYKVDRLSGYLKKEFDPQWCITDPDFGLGYILEDKRKSTDSERNVQVAVTYGKSTDPSFGVYIVSIGTHGAKPLIVGEESQTVTEINSLARVGTRFLHSAIKANSARTKRKANLPEIIIHTSCF